MRPLLTAICALGLLTTFADSPEPPARMWRFDGDLREERGFGSFSPQRNVTRDSYARADGRRVLHLQDGCVSAEDDLVFDLEPGMSFSLRIKFRKIPTAGECLVFRGNSPGGYFLRIDPPSEPRRLSFFVNLDGQDEPRVSSRREPTLNVWHDVSAGWDGTNIWLTVDGETTSTRRIGKGAPTLAPVSLSATDAEIADFRFRAGRPEAAPSDALAPGLRVNASLVFDKVPTAEFTELLAKPGEYMIRYENDARNAWSGFALFVRLDGGWEPRVRVPMKAEPGVPYNLVASWDGLRSRLSVNGRRASDIVRRGQPTPGGQPLRLDKAHGRFVHRAIRVCTRPQVLLEQLRTVELMPKDEQPFTVRAELVNLGATVRDCSVRVVGPADCKVSPAELSVGDLVASVTHPCEWRIEPGTNGILTLRFEVRSEGRVVQRTFKRLATMPPGDPDRSSQTWNPPVSGTRTYYVDSVAGDDTRDGLTPETAWRSFERVNPLELHAGERLLLKRGSVFNEELTVSARGSADDWVEIGAYGTGPRPTIRRNRDIDERCAYLEDPSYLVVRDLVVCNAGKGLIVACRNSDAQGHVLIERCLAHHIEGLYRFNSHGIPEWRDRVGAPGEGGGGFALAGVGMRHGVLRDCEMYQCSAGFHVRGDDMWIGRVFCHDNFSPNTSPHPFYTSTWRAWLVDSVFDASGYLASCGTMGIMLGSNHGLCIRGCHFVNMPHSGLCGDEGGIDFEGSGDNAVIRDCTFRNNAGAAIEVLGLRVPQARNTRIVGCRFDRDNHAHMLGPSEIYIWGDSQDRTVVCSNGRIEENGYVLAPGVSFFTNVSDLIRADWTLKDNRAFATSDELNRAFPLNDPPQVEAGAEIWTDKPHALLSGRLTDDGRGDYPARATWEQLEGPGIAQFDDVHTAVTTVTLPDIGDYRFSLKADDGQLWRTARTAVHVLPKGTKVGRAWTFARNLDTEGWTTNALGTAFERFPNENVYRQTHAYPVAHAVGDYFVLALKDSVAGCLVSADNLALAPAKGRRLLVKLQNHTSSDRMRLFWTTDGAPEFDKARSTAFAVQPQDDDDRLYVVPLPDEGTLRRLKLAITDGTPVTGTVRIDYLALADGP